MEESRHRISLSDYLTGLDERSYIDTPERNLLAAILERAISDVFTGDRRFKREAIAWIMQDSPLHARPRFSFEEVLDELGWLDIKDEIRRAIFRLDKFSPTHVCTRGKKMRVFRVGR